MTEHGKVKTLEDEFIPDDEVIYDYLVQKSNELEYEQIIISEIMKRLGLSGNQSYATCPKCQSKMIIEIRLPSNQSSMTEQIKCEKCGIPIIETDDEEENFYYCGDEKCFVCSKVTTCSASCHEELRSIQD